MKIVVCVKRVPDTEARIKVSSDGKGHDPDGVETILSPYDEIALEAAIQLREAGVADEVTIVSVGPATVTKELRTGLAMGADRAVLLVDDARRDASGVAAALAAELGAIGPDLVLCGWKAIDTDASEVPFRVAHALGMPAISYAVGIAVDGGKATVRREVEGTTEVIEVTLPAVVTAQKGLAEPRYPSLKGIMMAKKKPLEEKPAAPSEAILETVRMDPPPPRPEGRIVGKGADGVAPLLDALRNEAKVL